MAVGAAIGNAFRGALGLTRSDVGVLPGVNIVNDARMAAYRCYRAIYNGEHAAALADQYKLNAEQMHVVVNIPRLVVTIPADLMLGEPFTLDYPDDAMPEDADQKAVSEILKRSKLQTTAYEACVDAGYYGDILYVAERDENEQARIRAISPDIWFPEYDPDNIRDVKVHRLAWIRTVMDKTPKQYLRVLEHHKGEIINRLFSLKNGKVDEELSAGNGAWKQLYPEGAPELQQDTDVDDFLLVHVPNSRTSAEYFGQSDYQGKKGLFGAVNERTSHNNKILKDHAEPSMAVPAAMWSWLRGPDAQAEMGGSLGQRLLVDPRVLKISRMGDNGEKPEYITWDGRVEDSEAFVKRIKQDIYDLSEIDSSLVTGEGMGQVASGRALRLRLVRTLAKVNRKWKYQSEGLEKIIKLAAALEGIELEDLMLEKSDGLPADTLEDIQASTQRVNAGLSSRLREIMRLEDMDEAEAKALLDEIEEEEARAAEQMVQTVGAAQGGRTPIQVALK